MNYEYEFVRHTEATFVKLFLVSMTHRLYHWHNDIEILMVVNGSVTLETVNRKYRLSENDIFILNSNEVHCLSRTDENNTILTIQFDAKFCKACFPQLQRISFVSQHITEENSAACWEKIRKLLRQMVNEYSKENDSNKLRLMSTLHLLVCCLVENVDYVDSSEKDLSSQKKNLERLNRVVLNIKENHMKKISLKEIAENENLDMYYLSHLFKKLLGISYQEYVNKVRLEKAVELIMTTDMNMLDVCIESGFSEYRYLNKMFVKEYNCTAAEYKKLNKKAETITAGLHDESQSEVIYNENALEVFSALNEK